MSSGSKQNERDHLESAALYALRALPASELSAFESHLSTCSECRSEIEALGPVVDSFVSWPTDVLRPSASLWERLSRQVCTESGIEPVSLPPRLPAKPEWQEVAKGLSCRILSTDRDRSRVTLLVRFAPGTQYPGHRHSDIEECHVLQGDLWIDDKKFQAGDLARVEAGSVHHRAWSETGCTCVLLASLNDRFL